MRITTIAFLFAIMMTARLTVAQCPFVSPPASFVDLGAIAIGGQATVTQDLPIAAGQHIWIRFKVPEAIVAPDTWMDINTVGSTINAQLGLYDSCSYGLTADSDSAGGLAAGLSLGAGSGRRLGDVGLSGPLGRISMGQNLINTSVQLQANRFYYLVVIGQGADFSQNPNPNWQVSTSSTESGTVRVRISTGRRPQSLWNERWAPRSDAGLLPETAIIPDGTGPLQTILTAEGVDGRDMFKIRICDPASFLVTATPTRDTGGTSQVRMFLFDEQGRGVVARNNTIASTTTSLTLPSGYSAGIYYLAWANNCAGAFPGSQNTAYDEQNRLIWDFSASASWNVMLAPNGPGATGSVFAWGLPSVCSSSQAYWLNISCSGVCYPTSDCDDIDFNNDTSLFDPCDINSFLTVYSEGPCTPCGN